VLRFRIHLDSTAGGLPGDTVARAERLLDRARIETAGLLGCQLPHIHLAVSRFHVNDSRNPPALRSFPERIPIFSFHLDCIGLCCRLQAFEFAAMRIRFIISWLA
jgi:hypothetical protein